MGTETRVDHALAMIRQHFGQAGILAHRGVAFISPAGLLMSTSEVPLLRALEHGDFHSGKSSFPAMRWQTLKTPKTIGSSTSTMPVTGTTDSISPIWN